MLYRNFKITLRAETDSEDTRADGNKCVIVAVFFLVAVSDENAYCKTKALSQPERDLAHVAWLRFVSFIVQGDVVNTCTSYSCDQDSSQTTTVKIQTGQHMSSINVVCTNCALLPSLCV